MNTTDRNLYDNTISVELPNVRKGETAHISYNGVLTNSGADEVYLQYGFDGWTNTEATPMKKATHNRFVTDVEIDGNRELNFCFKDSANNWDNNHGIDWKVEIKS